MTHIGLYLTLILALHICTGQDYATPTYNQDVQNPTNDYYNNQYDNPYDPNRRIPNRNQYDINQFEPNRNQYGQYDNRNDQTYQNPYGVDNTPKPNWDSSRSYSPSFKSSELEHDSVIINEATYFIVASRMVRPGQIYKISANILRARLQMTIRASISRNGVEIADVIEKVKEGVPETLNMRVPATSVGGYYKLRVEGLYLDDPFGGRAFVNETQLTFSNRFMTIFIQMDKPVYKQGQTVKFRIIPINTELKAFGRAIDVYILDPSGRIMKRWLSRQSNFGTVSLQYQMSDQPQYGEWAVRVEALGQTELAHFLVEEYYQTRYEVNVTMPAFFFNTEPYIHGRIMANYTSGAPVRGNLTLKATVRPIPQYRPRYFTQGQFNNRGQPGAYGTYPTNQYTRVRQNFNPYLYNETYQYEYTDDRHGPGDVRHLPGQPNQLDQPDWWYDPQKVYTRLFNFDEKFPFWMPKPDPVQLAVQGADNPNYNTYSTSAYGNYYNDPYNTRLPYLRFFNGTYDFKYPMSELAQLVPTLDGVEVIITASVGDPFLDDVIEGYSIARIFNSSLAVTFLGGSLQVFKPAMPFDVYMVVSYHDGSPLPQWQAAGVSLLVNVQVEGRGGGIEPQRPTLASGHDAEGVRTFAVVLSAEMAPVATLLVWAAQRRGHLLADSLTFPVNGISRNNFTVFVNNRKHRTGERVEVAIYGEPGAYVGLSGIDDAFYTMQAGNELTYAKVISKMSHFDESSNGTFAYTFRSHFGDPDHLVYFPSSSFGIDANRTFEYAGLVVFSDVPVTRRHSVCNASLGLAECLDGGCYPRDKHCDGMPDCADRTDEASCEHDDSFSLSHFRKFRFNRVQRQYENAWLWRDVNIGPHGRYVFTVDVPRTPARWTISAFSMSDVLGFGVLNTPVKADGIPQYRHQSVLLDLSNRAYVFQYMHVNVTETPIIPYEVDRYYVFGSNIARVTVVGDVVGPLFPTMPVNTTSLLDLPMDSGEQNMFSFAANMYLTLYMRLTNQRNRSLERDAFAHMNVLYQRQLSFMKPDGSFSLFRSDWNQSASSVWLTSFCAKIFQEASFNEWENYIYIDPDVISMAVSWLLEHQTPEGAFYEVTWSPDRNANSTISVNDSIILQRNVTLTAQVVITLETVKNLKDIGFKEALSARVAQAQRNGITWLEKNLKLLEEYGSPYSLALVAYALTVSKAPSSEHAYRLLKRRQRSEGGLVYWGKEPVPQPPFKMENQKPFLLPRLPYKYDSNNIAATAYALLACMDHQDNNEPIVMWLNAQRLKDGGWASTQDTYIALRALIEYTNRKRLRDVSALSVSVEAVALRGAARTITLSNDHLAHMHTIQIPEAWGTVKVTARGAGYALLQLSVQYNVDVARFQTPPPAPAFSLITQARFYGRNQSHVDYRTCASWTLLEESPRSGMAVLEVGIPTGYLVQQQRLDAYVLSRRVHTLQRAKYQPDKILFYFDYLDHEQTCVNVTVERWFPVANISYGERFNETIFDALPTYLLNICEVCGSSQCPYCAVYNAAVRPAAVGILLTLTALLVSHAYRALAHT
ncbi:CD109 antigen [Papilio machaon]|uniref:CD109 antigen n=1 Tax=Papilio machaon TaxID=76193 RepID=A0A194QZL7_PAPMA|nr:CD109 antigen [Papilio machaon]